MKATFIAAIAMVTGINVFNAQKSEPLSDVVMANVEALAELEDDKHEVVVSCSASCKDGIGQCWKTFDEYTKYCTRTDDTSNFCSCK